MPTLEQKILKVVEQKKSSSWNQILYKWIDKLLEKTVKVIVTFHLYCLGKALNKN